MRSVTVLVLAMAAPAAADDDEPKRWLDGDHLTGDWGGTRDKLEDHGVTIEAVYTAEAFSDIGHGSTVLGHVDAALTLDTKKLELWPGGTFYVLGQNNHGTGIDERVGSAQAISNLEVAPNQSYTQLSELFYEQHLHDDDISIRIGKQDANRDFGTPRYGGNFLNNNSGMFPNSPLPSYPANGLGAVVAVQATSFLLARAAIYEASPQIGGFGLDTAFKDGAGYTLVGGVAATHHYGPEGRHDGTTSLGVWHETGEFDEIGVAMPRTFDTNDGFFIQHDEHIYSHPDDPKDATGLTVILRFSWARPDRSITARYAGGTAAWHGLRSRNDTVGIGVGYFTLGEQTGGTPGSGSELYVELTYKLRLTKFISFQEDIELYRHPGGDGPDAFVAGGRLKVKL
jgi:porin